MSGRRHQPRDTRDQDIVRRRGNADDHACGRDDAVVGAEHRGSQSSDAPDEVILRAQAKSAHPIYAVRSNPTHEKQHDEDDHDNADKTDAAVTVAVAVAAEAAAESTKQENDEDDDKYEP
jgi:hypothetical protein